MAISKKTLDLINLALQDRVLTFKERQVIVENATKEGTPTAEINALIDNMLAQRLQSYTKEELKRCPHCGAQIPLISDVCLFCGETLENSANAPKTPQTVEGNEAEIINEENRITADQIKNLKTCPDCGAPFPLVSNVCTHCGHILHEQKDSDLNVKNLINSIQNSIDELKNTPQPSFGDVMSYRNHIFVFLFAMLMLAVSIKMMWSGFADQESNIFFVVLGLSFVLLVSAIIKASKKRGEPSPATAADNKFFAALHRKEMCERQISTLYGNNSEAKEALSRLDALTDKIKQNRDRRTRSVVIAFSIAVAVLMSLIVMILYKHGVTIYNYK